MAMHKVRVKMETTSEEHDSLPAELKERLASFDESLTHLESSLQPLLSVPRSELSEKLSPLDQAKVDLLSGYALNSMFWMYLNTCGENPKDHGVKQELDRIRTYMGRVKEIQDKANAPKLDQKASKRIIKSALWQAALKKTKENPEEEGTVEKAANEDGQQREESKRPLSDKEKEKRKKDIPKPKRKRYHNSKKPIS